MGCEKCYTDRSCKDVPKCDDTKPSSTIMDSNNNNNKYDSCIVSSLENTSAYLKTKEAGNNVTIN